MTSKSELKRKATLDPFWAETRIRELEEELAELRKLRAEMLDDLPPIGAPFHDHDDVC